MNVPVSVCIPTCNGARHLDDCLRSVLSQSYRDFEVLVVDDHSTDETLEIVGRYALSDGRFRVYINPQRLGLVGNWNRCIELARGGWVKFVFQDDLIFPDCLAKMMECAQREAVPFVACRRSFVYENGVSNEKREFYEANARSIAGFYGSNGKVGSHAFIRKILALIGDNFVGEPTVTLIQRGVLLAHGVFNPHLIMCCDSECWYRLGSHAGVAYLPETLAGFRVHGGSASADAFGSRRYRMEILDPLVIEHEFLWSDHYIPLRKVAEQELGANYLRGRCGAQALLAWRKSGLAVRSHAGEYATNRKEWSEIVRAYPRLRWLAVQEWIHQKIISIYNNAKGVNS